MRFAFVLTDVSLMKQTKFRIVEQHTTLWTAPLNIEPIVFFFVFHLISEIRKDISVSKGKVLSFYNHICPDQPDESISK